MAANSQAQGAVELATIYKSFLFDLPLASMKWSFGINAEKEASEAAWKGYDASVRLATTTIDALYRSPLFSDVAGRTLNMLLRWQQIGNAVNGTVFTGLWKALGVPTAAEMESLAEQLRSVEEKLSHVAEKKDLRVILDQLHSLEASMHRSAQAPLRNGRAEGRIAA
jgi:hypothetical protein